MKILFIFFGLFMQYVPMPGDRAGIRVFRRILRQDHVLLVVEAKDIAGILSFVLIMGGPKRSDRNMFIH